MVSNKPETRYEQVYLYLKKRMEDGTFGVGSKLPSEHELCRNFSVTRTTVRTAMAMLENEGLIERSQGRPARVKARNQRLGLLTVKGFSEAAGTSVEMHMLQAPASSLWPDDLPFGVHAREKTKDAMHFSRIRLIGGAPVMLESNWFAAGVLDGIGDGSFSGGSFFRTLADRYNISITASEQELHALLADGEPARLLKVEPGQPLLQIYIRFTTSKAGFYIYSRLLCNTDSYKIGNTYSS